jgi:hypothetical protein
VVDELGNPFLVDYLETKTFEEAGALVVLNLYLTEHSRGAGALTLST